jgi:hypothetical protein
MSIHIPCYRMHVCVYAVIHFCDSVLFLLRRGESVCFVLFFVCLFVDICIVVGSPIEFDRMIFLTSLHPPHFFATAMTWITNVISYLVVYCLWSVVWGEKNLFILLILVELLCISPFFMHCLEVEQVYPIIDMTHVRK